jgi:hypothetical protein
MRRQALEEELQHLAPPADPQLDHAQEVLGDFPRFWKAEPDPAERRKLINSLFAHTWQDNGAIVAVKPHAAFAPYFKALDGSRRKSPKAGRQRGVTKAGTTGLEPATSDVTGRRQLAEAYDFMAFDRSKWLYNRQTWPERYSKRYSGRCGTQVVLSMNRTEERQPCPCRADRRTGRCRP